MFRFISCLILLFPSPLAAADNLDGATIFDRATTAAGGEAWANAKSLMLEGHAVFWGAAGAEPKSTVDSYIMYREFDPNRSAAHGAEGKVRIIVSDKAKLVWTVGYDGQTTWTERGITPMAEADSFWASNFGFGIIRHARKPGFKAERVADGQEGLHLLYIVRLTDPGGGITLFGIDQKSYAIRTMGFTTPKGWHERVYDDFIRLKNPDWLQARSVTLFYNGVKANTVFWDRVKVNPIIDPAVFQYKP
jgi:hypothetical protein